MNIGLVDVDSHNFPNIPLMKLSAYHKRNGDRKILSCLTRIYLPVKTDRIYWGS